MLLYLPEAPFLRILKRTSNSIYPTFYPTQKKGADYQLLFPQLSAQDRD